MRALSLIIAIIYKIDQFLKLWAAVSGDIDRCLPVMCRPSTIRWDVIAQRERFAGTRVPRADVMLKEDPLHKRFPTSPGQYSTGPQNSGDYLQNKLHIFSFYDPSFCLPLKKMEMIKFACTLLSTPSSCFAPWFLFYKVNLYLNIKWLGTPSSHHGLFNSPGFCKHRTCTYELVTSTCVALDSSPISTVFTFVPLLRHLLKDRPKIINPLYGCLQWVLLWVVTMPPLSRLPHGDCYQSKCVFPTVVFYNMCGGQRPGGPV